MEEEKVIVTADDERRCREVAQLYLDGNMGGVGRARSQSYPPNSQTSTTPSSVGLLCKGYFFPSTSQIHYLPLSALPSTTSINTNDGTTARSCATEPVFASRRPFACGRRCSESSQPAVSQREYEHCLFSMIRHFPVQPILPVTIECYGIVPVISISKVHPGVTCFVPASWFMGQNSFCWYVSSIVDFELGV
jgi:hypothetical protein